MFNCFYIYFYRCSSKFKNLCSSKFHKFSQNFYSNFLDKIHKFPYNYQNLLFLKNIYIIFLKNFILYYVYKVYNLYTKLNFFNILKISINFLQRICIPFQKNVLTLRENFVIKSQQQEQQQQQQLHHQQEEEEGLNKCSSEPSFPQINNNK